MDKIRIGNDIHIVWSIFRDNQPEVFEGKDVEVRLIHTRTRDVIPLEWVISDGVVSATFYGKDQIDTGDYKLMLVENNGAPNMATIDECKAFTLVQYSCQEQKEEPSTSLQLHKVQLTSYFALSGGGNISVEGYPNVDELEEVKELSGNENIIITDSEGNKKTTIGNLKEYVVKDISELPPFRIFETESDYNAVKDELGDCVVCLRDTGVMLYHVYNKTEEGGGEIEDKYIRFADPEVQRILVENFSSDGVGMTSEDIAKVTSIGTVFNGNTIIETFDEFEKFTAVTKLGAGFANNSSSAFYECGNLKSIKLPSSVYEIGYYAFQNCSNLTNVGSTENITTILTEAFRGCRSLVQDVDLPNLTKLSNGAFNGSAISSVNIGKATEIIGAYQNGAFYNCSELRSVEYDENLLTKIGQYTFANCSKLIMNIPINATIIGNSAFLNCSSIEIENLVLPKLESLGDNVFSGVNIKRIAYLGKITTLPTANTSKQNFGNKSVLEVVVLPSTLTTITGASFDGYAKLTAVVLLATTPVSLEGINAFTNTNNCPFYIPDTSVEAYKTATNWSTYASRIKGISELRTDNAELYEEIKDYLN